MPVPKCKSSPKTTVQKSARAFDLSKRLLKWISSVRAYLVGFAGILLAFQTVRDRLGQVPQWVLFTVPVPILLAFAWQSVSFLLERRRKRRLEEVTGDLKPGYFRLTFRTEEEDFERADNKHQEILRWLTSTQSPVLYLTGASGSGKSSLLAAWVLPMLAKHEPPVKIIQLRGFQDPLHLLSEKLAKPNVIWQRPSPKVHTPRALLEGACRQVKPGKLLIVFDQFEEFIILRDRKQRKRTVQTV